MGGAAGTRHVEVERLSAWISGELSERDTALVRAHVEICPACRTGAAELRAQVVATRALDRPEPPPTLWSAIEGALEAAPRRRWWWSWPATFTGALAGAAAVVVLAWGWGHLRDARGLTTTTAGDIIDGVVGASRGAGVRQPAGVEVRDPLLAEAERELERAAVAYEEAAGRLRKIFEREQTLWDPETRARVGERLARLDEAVAHARAVARQDPGSGSGADMLFSAYQRQIDFLAEAVHRGSPAAEEGLR